MDLPHFDGFVARSCLRSVGCFVVRGSMAGFTHGASLLPVGEPLQQSRWELEHRCEELYKSSGQQKLLCSQTRATAHLYCDVLVCTIALPPGSE